MKRLFTEDTEYTQEAINLENELIAALEDVLKKHDLNDVDGRDIQSLVRNAAMGAGLSVILNRQSPARTVSVEISKEANKESV